MRKLLSIFFFSFVVVAINAQTTQKGIIQEYNEKARKTPLPGVELNVRSANSTMSDKDGNFTLQFLTLKPGEKVNIRRIEKLGYEIFNKEAVEQWNINPKNPFVIVMCRSDRFKKIRDNYEKVSSESYARQLKKEEAALLRQKEEGKLKEAEYQKQLFELRENYEKQLDNLDSYVDRFSRIDLSELSAIEQEIIALVQEGKIEEAIAKYDEQNYVDKYTHEVAQLKEISSAIDQLSEVKQSKEASRDSLLAAIDRQIETLRIAGGKDNIEGIAIILKDVALADTTSHNNVIKYAEFCIKHNKLADAKKFLQKCRTENIGKDTYFKILMLNGNLNRQEGNLTKALDYYKEALDVARTIQNENMQAVANHNIGTVMLDQGKNDDAFEYFTVAKELREKYSQESTDELFNLSTTYGNIGRVLENKKDFNNAIEYYQKAIAIQKNFVDQDNGKYGETLANTYNSMGAMFHELRDFDKAKEYYLQGLAILENLYKLNPFSTALTYANMLNNYGASLTDIASYEESLFYFKKAIDVYDFISSFAPTIAAIPLAMTKVNMANADICLGNLDNAKTTFEEAFNLFDNLGSPETPYINEKVTILSNYAIVLTDLHDIEGAEKSYKKAFDMCNSAQDNSLAFEITKGRTYFALGNFYSTILNKQQEAQPYFHLSIAQFKKLMETIPQVKAYVSMSLNGLAYSYMFQGDSENAIDKINEAITLSPEDPNFIDSKIEIQYSLSDYDGAKQTLESYKAANPDFNVQSLPSYKLIYGE